MKAETPLRCDVGNTRHVRRDGILSTRACAWKLNIAMTNVSYDVITALAALHNKLEAFAVHNASAKEC